MTMTTALRAACAVAALAVFVPGSASDVSYDQAQLREPATAGARQARLVASTGAATCQCEANRSAKMERRAEEEVAPRSVGEPERPTTGINRR